MDDDAKLVAVIEGLQVQFLTIEALKLDPECGLNKRALSIAATELETAMLWIANSRQD